MVRPGLPEFLIDLAKIVGGAVKDAVGTENYRITIMIEKKVDDNVGVIVDSISIDKKMTMLDIGAIKRKLKELVENR